MSFWIVFLLLVSVGVEGQSDGSGDGGDDGTDGDGEAWQYVTYLKTVKYDKTPREAERTFYSFFISVRNWKTFYRKHFWPRTRD